MNQPKREPNADLRQFASVVYQMYVALCDEGFKPHEALVVVGTAVSAMLGKPAS